MHAAGQLNNMLSWRDDMYMAQLSAQSSTCSFASQHCQAACCVVHATHRNEHMSASTCSHSNSRQEQHTRLVPLAYTYWLQPNGLAILQMASWLASPMTSTLIRSPTRGLNCVVQG